METTIKFLKDAGGHAKGESVTIESRHADTICALGLAEKVEMTKLESHTPEKIETEKPPRKPRTRK